MCIIFKITAHAGAYTGEHKNCFFFTKTHTRISHEHEHFTQQNNDYMAKECVSLVLRK